jgi:hypothetical protein
MDCGAFQDRRPPSACEIALNRAQHSQERIQAVRAANVSSIREVPTRDDVATPAPAYPLHARQALRDRSRLFIRKHACDQSAQRRRASAQRQLNGETPGIQVLRISVPERNDVRQISKKGWLGRIRAPGGFFEVAADAVEVAHELLGRVSAANQDASETPQAVARVIHAPRIRAALHSSCLAGAH